MKLISRMSRLGRLEALADDLMPMPVGDTLLEKYWSLGSEELQGRWAKTLSDDQLSQLIIQHVAQTPEAEVPEVRKMLEGFGLTI